jgi:hypothetical protein
VKYYTPEQIQALPLPELRLAVAERLGIECRLAETWKSSPEIFSMIGEIEFNAEWSVDREWLEAGTPVQVLANGGIRELPDWASDLSEAAKLTEKMRTMFFSIFVIFHDYDTNVSVLCQKRCGHDQVVIQTAQSIDMRGATEAEARTRAWLAAMQEEE